MLSMLFGRPSFLSMTLLGASLWLVPSALRAQTFDSAAGVGPSQKLSTPPNADPINRPGAMERAYGHPATAAHTPQHSTTPAVHKTPTPPPH